VNRLPVLLTKVFLASFILSACAPADSPAPTPPTNTANARDRFGTTKVAAVRSSGISGTFTAKDNGNGTTTLSIRLDRAEDFNPWGLFSTGDCQNGVPENTRPIFSLPDIESGVKEETVETVTYASAPGNLIVLVYGMGPNGDPQMVACGELGPATVTRLAGTASAGADCSSSTTRQAPEPSSDSWLAFSATENSNGDIYLLDVDAALKGEAPAPLRLTNDPADDFDPTWSPDGTRIAFRSQRDGNDEIYIMNSDGTCQTDLTNDPAGDWSPSWSPDGKRIAFAHFFDGNSYTDIAVIQVDGTALQRLTEAGGEYPAWSPDGSRIAFASARDGNYEIYVMNADGTDQTNLTKDPAYDMSPAWSADGTAILFDTQRDQYPPVEVGIGPEFEIHLMKADGRHAGDTRLTSNQQEDRFPAWGPQGLIAFTHNGALFLMRSDGSNQIQLAKSGFFPAWWQGR
jgi:hypothetical protein